MPKKQLTPKSPLFPKRGDLKNFHQKQNTRSSLMHLLF